MKKLVRVCACLVVLVAAALAGAQTAAYGQKVVVSPADLKGWVQTSRSGYVAPPNGGTYLVYSGFLEEGQALSTGGAEQQVPPGNPKGPGAFFLFTNIGINTPGMVTLGNDLLNGVPLKNITTLKYTTYTFADGNNPAQHCMSPDYKWGLVSHPISLDLYAENDPAYVDELLALEPGQSARGTWHLTGDEWFFPGHFPGRRNDQFAPFRVKRDQSGGGHVACTALENHFGGPF